MPTVFPCDESAAASATGGAAGCGAARLSSCGLAGGSAAATRRSLGGGAWCRELSGQRDATGDDGAATSCSRALVLDACGAVAAVVRGSTLTARTRILLDAHLRDSQFGARIGDRFAHVGARLRRNEICRCRCRRRCWRCQMTMKSCGAARAALVALVPDVPAVALGGAIDAVIPMTARGRGALRARTGNCLRASCAWISGDTGRELAPARILAKTAETNFAVRFDMCYPR